MGVPVVEGVLVGVLEGLTPGEREDVGVAVFEGLPVLDGVEEGEETVPVPVGLGEGTRDWEGVLDGVPVGVEVGVLL